MTEQSGSVSYRFRFTALLALNLRKAPAQPLAVHLQELQCIKRWICAASLDPAHRADQGVLGPPFTFDPERRAILSAELDAIYARLYGLSRDDLRYILDPADVMGADYPSESFRVLKDKEVRHLGEYRTRRLVLEAWDRMEQGEL